MMANDNPFVIKAYESRELFCDREEELQLMMRNCVNRTDMTLISQRRMGKTGLIMRLFDELITSGNDIRTIYLDIFASHDLADFIKLLAEATMRTFPERTTIGDRLLKLIRSLRPQMTFDSITGEPQLQVAYQSPAEKEYTLRGLIEFLDSQGVNIVVAIDEFQQIRDYPEANVEALLRTYIQHTHNLTFIFCGSKKHLMTDIFANERRPFYSSTMFVTLGKIDHAVYADFIGRLFVERRRSITDEAVEFILQWTARHTYFTQQLCHTVYANGNERIDVDEVKRACDELMKQNEPIYLQYRQMLTAGQWQYLIAVAKRGSVRQITASSFLNEFQIGTPSASRRLAQSLCEKGLLNNEATIDGTVYTVADIFMSHWMQRL